MSPNHQAIALVQMGLNMDNLDNTSSRPEILLLKSSAKSSIQYIYKHKIIINM